MAREFRVAAVVVALSALNLVLPTAALASCEPPRAQLDGANFVGTQKTPGGVPKAVETQIEEYSPYTEVNTSTAWNMLTNFVGYAQVGTWKGQFPGRWAFAQWTVAVGQPPDTEFFSPGAIGTTPNYQTIYNQANNKYIFERNNVVLWQATSNFVPTNVQIYGELHDMADQMPGAVNNTVSLKEAHYTMGAGWLNIGTAAHNTDPGNFGVNKINNEFYTIWDRDCQF